MSPIEPKPSESEAAPAAATATVAPVAHLALKARLLVAAVALLLAGAVLYILYARGAFERTQTLVLVADNAEGVLVGMDLSFAGFPVGRVRRIELGEDGQARIIFDVPVKDARWLRVSSVFTMESGLVGAPRIRAFSGMLSDPPLADGAVRPVLRGDAAAEIPRLTAAVRDLLNQMVAMTDEDAPLNETLRQLRSTSERLNGPRGVLGVLMGNEQDAQRVLTALERSNALLARLDGLTQRTDGMVARADAQIFGDKGLTQEVQAMMRQLNGALADTRQTLVKVDRLLVEAQGVASNAREASADLGALRAEVETSLRRVEQLVNEVNRRWPFARDTEIRLP